MYHIKSLTARMRADAIVWSVFLLIGVDAFTPLLSSNVVFRSSSLLPPSSSPSGLFNRIPITKYTREKTELKAFLLKVLPNGGSSIITKLILNFKKVLPGFISKLVRIITSPFFVALSYILTTLTKKTKLTATAEGSMLIKTAIAKSELSETTSKVEKIVIQIDKDKEEKALNLFLKKKEKAEEEAQISIEAERSAAIALAKNLGYVSRTPPSKVQFDMPVYDFEKALTLPKFPSPELTPELTSTLTAFMVTVLAIGAAR